MWGGRTVGTVGRVMTANQGCDCADKETDGGADRCCCCWWLHTSLVWGSGPSVAGHCRSPHWGSLQHTAAHCSPLITGVSWLCCQQYLLLQCWLHVCQQDEVRASNLPSQEPKRVDLLLLVPPDPTYWVLSVCCFARWEGGHGHGNTAPAPSSPRLYWPLPGADPRYHPASSTRPPASRG